MKGLTVWIVSVAILGSFVSVASADDVVLAALGYGRLAKFDSTGNVLGGRNIPAAASIAYASNGNSYVATIFTQNVYRYDAGGHAQSPISPTLIDGEIPALLGGSAVGPNDDYYLGVAANTRRIERFDSAGNSIGALQLGGSNGGSPLALAFDGSGNLFVDMGYSIVSFDPAGAPRGTFATLSQVASDIAVDSSNNLFVATRSSVRQYSPTGQLLGSFNPGFNAVSLAFGDSDVLYVGGETTNGTSAVIKKFSSGGTLLGSFSQIPYLPNSGGNMVTDLVVRGGGLTEVFVPEPTSIFIAITASCIFPIAFRCRRKK